MRSTIIIFLTITSLYASARVIKRQKKIARVFKPCGCQSSSIEFSPKGLVEAAVEAAYGCLSTCVCPSACNQNIFVEEPCGYIRDSYGILNAELLNDRIPPIRLPMATIDAGIPVPAINLPFYQCDFPSCQCQNMPYPFDSPCSKISVPAMPVDIRTVYIEPPSALKMPSCASQMAVEIGCQRQNCGCQLSALDIPCSCQMPALGRCGCTLSTLDPPCGCQLPAFNLPCGCQLPGLDCGCQFQAFNSCGGQTAGGLCGCQLPKANVPYAYQQSLDMPCAGQLPCLEGCGCQIPGCGCQLTPPAVGCGKYLRQVTLQPPFL